MSEETIIQKYKKTGVKSLSSSECLEMITGEQYKETIEPLGKLIDLSNNVEIQLFKDIMKRYKEERGLKDGK